VLYHALPIYHVHGLFVASHCVLLSGSRMWFCAKFDAKEARALLPKSTVMMGVPTFYTRLLADPQFGADDCRTIRLFVSGSAPLLPETFAQFERVTGQRILERYGMTETGMLTSNPYEGPRKPGTVGFPLPGVSLRLAESGEVQVRGPNVIAGYHERPDADAEAFSEDGWFRTGDLGELDEDGYLTLVGRSKDLIISGGYNVHPREVEEALESHPDVHEAAVIGRPSERWGEQVTAIVVVERPTDAERLREHAASRLAPYKVPKAIEFATDLPRNALGKLQRNQLR